MAWGMEKVYGAFSGTVNLKGWFLAWSGGEAGDKALGEGAGDPWNTSVVEERFNSESPAPLDGYLLPLRITSSPESFLDDVKFRLPDDISPFPSHR